MSGYVARFQLTLPWVLVYLPCIWGMALASVALSVGLGWTMSEPPEPGAADPFMSWTMLLILIAAIPIFWNAALAWTIAFATKHVALRVDETGVTLGRGANLLAPIVTVPWADLKRIVLFEYYMEN